VFLGEELFEEWVGKQRLGAGGLGMPEVGSLQWV